MTDGLFEARDATSSTVAPFFHCCASPLDVVALSVCRSFAPALPSASGFGQAASRCPAVALQLCTVTASQVLPAWCNATRQGRIEARHADGQSGRQAERQPAGTPSHPRLVNHTVGGNQHHRRLRLRPPATLSPLYRTHRHTQLGDIVHSFIHSSVRTLIHSFIQSVTASDSIIWPSSDRIIPTKYKTHTIAGAFKDARSRHSTAVLRVKVIWGQIFRNSLWHSTRHCSSVQSSFWKLA